MVPLSEVPKRVWCEANPTETRRTALHSYLDKFPNAHKLFKTLGDMSHVARLGVNLRVVCAQLSNGPVEDILRDGLTPTEKKALLEIEAAIPETMLEVAHGLLNVHQRWLLVRTLSKQFRSAVVADTTEIVVEHKPLDPILGK